MNLIRLILTGVVAVHGMLIFFDIQYVNFDLQNEFMNLTKLSLLGLSLWVLWDHHTTARFKMRTEVQKLRIFMTVILGVFLIVDIQQVGMENLISGIFSSEYLFPSVILIMIVYLWTKKLDQLILKD